MHGRQQPHHSSNPSPAGAANALAFLVHTWAASVEVFLRKDFGDRFLGIHAAGVLLLAPIFGVFWEGYDVRPLFWFVPVYLGAVAVARLGIAWRKCKGIHIHSFYSGFPRCMKARSRVSEVQFKRYFEPVLAAATGLTFCMLEMRPLGVFLMIAGVCVYLSVTMSQLQFEQRAAAMNDQVLEQQYIAERFREMQGQSF